MLRTLVVFAPFVLCACPVLSQQPASSEAPLGYAGSGSLQDELDAAEAAQFAPVPSEATLCRLGWDYDDISDVKALLGTPEAEQLDASNAALSYRYRQEVTIHLTFRWSDGRFDTGEVIKHGASAGRTGYVLFRGAIMGRAYPGCWPHEESE